MPSIGRLDQLLIFEVETTIEDGFGGGAISWGETARAWASVKPVSAREGDRQGALRASTIYMIELWSEGIDTVTEACRINWDGVYLNIRELRRPPHRTMMMAILAESGVTQ